jgi:hypothetical protein
VLKHFKTSRVRVLAMKPFLVLLLFFMAAAVSVPSLRSYGQRRELSAADDAPVTVAQPAVAQCPDGMSKCDHPNTLCGSFRQIYHEADKSHDKAWCNRGSVMGVCSKAEGSDSLYCCDNREHVKQVEAKCSNLEKAAAEHAAHHVA